MKNTFMLALYIAAITFLTPFLSFCQQNEAQRKRQMHNEIMSDPYLPNAHQNQKTSRGYSYNNTETARLLNSSIITTQVNVDLNGNNIIGDAANEPSIAVNPVNAGEIVIGWRQFDNVTSSFRQAGWSFTSDSGQTWTFPGVIEPGIFRSDPVLDFDSNGNFYYNSLTNSPTYMCKVFKSTNGGATWNAGTDAAGGDKQWMTIDRTTGVGSGNIYSFWTFAYSSCSPGFFTRSTTANSSYESCTVVDGYPFYGTMAVGNNGELYLAGLDTLYDSLVVAKSLNAQVSGSLITWNAPVNIYMGGSFAFTSINIAGLPGQINIDVNHAPGPGQGNVYIVAPISDNINFDPSDVMFAKSTDGGLTWSAPLRINNDVSVTNTQWFPTMSVAPNGRIDVIWLDTRESNGSDSSALYYSYSVDNGNTWSANQKMSTIFDPHIGYPNQQKMGDYFDMVSDNAGAHLSWAGTFNGEQDVYYSRIIPPVSTGLIETSLPDFSIYPNPATRSIMIRNWEINESLLEIINAIGEKMYSTLLLNSLKQIDTSELSAGMYFVKKVNSNGKTFVKKLIIE